MTRRFSRNTLEDAFKELAELRRQVDEIINNKEKSLPFRDKDNFPPGVEGQIVLATYVPPIPTAIGDMIFLGYRTADDFYQSIYKLNADTGVLTEILAGDTTDGSLEYHYALWSRDRTKIYADKFIDSTTMQMWSVNPDGTAPTMLLEITGLSSYHGTPRVSFKDTTTGLKMTYWDNSSPSNLRVYDIMAGTYTTVFNSSSLPSPYTNRRPDTVQWNPNGDKISFFCYDSGSATGLFTMNLDGTGFHGPILTGDADFGSRGVWWSQLNKLTYQTGSPDQFLAVINPDGTGQDDLTSFASNYGVFSPDGSKIAFTEWTDSNVHIINADGTSDVSVPSSSVGGSSSNRLVWSPDGTRIAKITYEETSNEILIIDVASATVTSTLTVAAHYITFLNWDPFFEGGQFN